MASDDESEGLINELYSEVRARGEVAYFNSARSELSIRCPYCGDSQKNANSAHLYIMIQAPFPFMCQRCQTSGYLNRETLKDFQIENTELVVSISKASKDVIKDTTKRTSGIKGGLLGNRKLIIPEYTYTNAFNRKVGYLNDRLGLDLDDTQLRDLKVITDYRKFLVENNLEGLFRFYDQSDYHANLFQWLQRYSVGFLSSDTNFIGFRHTKIPANGRRYYSESMNRPYNTGNRLYTIKNEIDILTPELNLVLAEGTIDIISIFHNIYDGIQDNNTIFGSVNGKAYRLFITTLRRMGFLRINLDIYSDSEINRNNYKYQLNFDNFSSVRVHYNNYVGQGDFGVPKDKIKIKTYKLK